MLTPFLMKAELRRKLGIKLYRYILEPEVLPIPDKSSTDEINVAEILICMQQNTYKDSNFPKQNQQGT